MAAIIASERGNNGHSVAAGEKLLTVSEAAGVMRVHPNSVRRWADMGLLPVYRIGLRRDRRLRPRDVSDFLVSWKGGVRQAVAV